MQSSYFIMDLDAFSGVLEITAKEKGLEPLAFMCKRKTQLRATKGRTKIKRFILKSLSY